MKYKVHMLAFKGPVQVREVEIELGEYLSCESTEQILNVIYHWGQNDFQPQQCYSVSAGDVIELPPKETGKGKLSAPANWEPGYWLVNGKGFRHMDQAQFDIHKAKPEAERSLSAYNL